MTKKEPTVQSFAFVNESGISSQDFGKRLVKSGLVSRDEIEIAWKSLDKASRSASGLASALAERDRLTPTQARLITGDEKTPLVLGVYVIEDKLGEGGMGQVYRAVHKKMKREVALKVISPQMLWNSTAERRFSREVESAARLSHPNIVAAHDAGESGGVHYLVMEYVVGSDLAAVIHRSGPLPMSTGINYTLQAAQGLAHAHDAGVVHRDIKPANLLVDSSGTVKILDMGLARLDSQEDEAASRGLTNTGMVMGTPDYMAPEQAADAKTADVRSDIYSLGCTLFFLLTGRTVYVGGTVMKRILAHREEPVPKLSQVLRQASAYPELVRQLEQVFERMIAKSPEDRYSTMHEVVEALERIAQQAKNQSGAEAIQGESEATQGKSEATLMPSSSDVSPSETRPSVLPVDTVDIDELPKVEPSKPPRADISRGRPPASIKRLAFGLGGLAALVVLILLAFKFRGTDGMVVVELDSTIKVASVEIDGNSVEFSVDGSDRRLQFQVDSGTHQLTINLMDGTELTTSLGKTPLEIKPGDTMKLRAWVDQRNQRATDANVVIDASAAVDHGPWIEMFTGKNTSEWRELGPFQVIGDELVAKSKGTAASKRRFSDFELEFEWSLSNRSNGGIFYRARENAAESNSPEFALVQGSLAHGGFDSGSLWGVLATTDRPKEKPNEFNRGRIRCLGSKVEHYINEGLVLEYDTTSPEFQKAFAQRNRIAFPNGRLPAAAGVFYLQAVGGEVRYKNIRVREIFKGTSQ